MTDYTELVKALRHRQGRFCYGEGACPDTCMLILNNGCYTKLCCDAAAAIEELEAEVEKHRTAWAKLAKDIDYTVTYGYKPD